MKVRWTESSVRLRITPAEMDAVLHGETVTEALAALPGGAWRVALGASEAAASTLAFEAGGTLLRVALSEADRSALADPAAEGVYLKTPDGAVRYYVEKDVPCAHPRAGEAMEPATETFAPPPGFEERKNEGGGGSAPSGEDTGFVAAVLAGGRSHRMGRDKAALTLDGENGGGETLLAHAVRVAREAGAREVLVVGRTEAPEGATAAFGDDIPGMGPLGGIATALRHADGLPVLALGCDMPKLTPEAVRWLWEASAAQSGEDAAAEGVAAVGGPAGGRIEPLFAVYRAACLPRLGHALGAGALSATQFVAEGRFGRAAVPPEHAAALTNVNTPEEFAAATAAVVSRFEEDGHDGGA
ncbi:MAG TPA: molybdenum cofactor guanylyltransferase [Armatimonadaceae bacterium]|nr:molybdenum cofactor guanylyltransferase [Armatimonadaceae bacterium]